MATLILTAIGTAVAGPIGGALGAALGQQIDQRIFAPRGREGPRLAQLAIQSSAYGAPIPLVFGTMRLAGSVIWATDLREDRRTVSQGKGRPKATVYSYSASFAVALSGRPGVRVGRIWADGKLLRGAAGDFKVQTGFRFYAGREDQPVDPLIAAIEGAGQAPAYRGLCYCVFEDLALEDYGNRIPLISFELIADEGPVRADMILNSLGSPLVQAQCDAPFAGYVADGGSVRAAMAPLTGLLGLDIWDDGRALKVSAAPPSRQRLAAIDLGAQGGLKGGPAKTYKTAARAGMPSVLRLSYADTARDYQPGEQRADLYLSGRSDAREIPAALDATTARQRAFEALIESRTRGDELGVSLPWRALGLMSGPAVTLDDTDGSWRIASLTLESMRLEVRLNRLAATGVVASGADAGRGLAAPDVAHGPTHIVLAELPALDTGVAQKPIMVVAAAGPLPGWRKAALLQSTDGGALWTEIGTTAAPAILGRVIDPPGAGPAHLVDHKSSLTVALLHDGMTLASCDDAALLAGRNLMLVGAEVLQFGQAERVGPARYRLSRLLRGRRGTEAQITGHQSGEDAVLIANDSLVSLDIPAGATSVQIMATGLAETDPVRRDAPILGVAVRPLSPVHLSCARAADGSVRFQWVRRSRDGWAWPDAIEAPLAEERERYRITFLPDIGPEWSDEVAAPLYTLPAAKVTALRAAGATGLRWHVRQLGSAAVSLPGQSPFQTI